ncbi:hypothetical protein AC579_10431 [Pseudocercospora musae]|uniref:Pre-rRNA-processing protein RIX1 n=1 Tax=Pseudocercospora musae TaxID=113226 RepID=A0A139IKQ4_9PEZI|nr:hypothetical protein AC579_10431 [Pseudocercospora musae]
MFLDLAGQFGHIVPLAIAECLIQQPQVPGTLFGVGRAVDTHTHGAPFTPNLQSPALSKPHVHAALPCGIEAMFKAVQVLQDLPSVCAVCVSDSDSGRLLFLPIQHVNARTWKVHLDGSRQEAGDRDCPCKRGKIRRSPSPTLPSSSSLLFVPSHSKYLSMAQPSSQSLSTLRAVTYRITTTSPQELPLVAAQISASIWNCRHLISLPSENKHNRETSEILKRFHTRLASLLQERSIEGRWAAVVLVKATIEAGGLEVLSKCNAWVKILLGYLKKPDPPTTRNLTLITLTRIFMLTWDYSNLVREITTPSLTALLPICLSNLENKRCSSREFETILEAFVTLLPRHPTIFRNNEAKLRSILSSVLSGASLHTGSRCAYPESQRFAAERLLVLLHHCAPKQGSSEKWHETLKAHTQAAHATCDRVFRAVHEHWQSATGVESSAPAHQILNGDLESENEDAAGLKPWKGVFAGSERLIALLRIIDAHLMTATFVSISVPLGILEDLLARIFSVVPAIAKQDGLKANDQISKDEREAMFAALPRIHVAALQLAASIHTRFQAAASALVTITVERILHVFQAQHDDSVREAVFTLVQQFLDRYGLSMTRNEVSDLSPVLKAACQEVYSASELKSQSQNGTGGVKQQLGLSGGQVTQSHPTNRSTVVESAKNLLYAVLRKVDAGVLSHQIRAQIDRAAILTQDQQLLTASVMNPARKKNTNHSESSLMPFLVRNFGGCAETEALLRPRMPLVRVAKSGHEEGDEANDAIDEEEEENDNFQGEENVAMEETQEIGGAENEKGLEQVHAHDPSFHAAQGAAEDLLRGDSNAVITTSDMSSTGKRRADEGVDAQGAVKRAKTNSPKPQMPPTVAPAPVNSSQATSATAVPEQPDFGDDDSDLEIPALNPDPDTDPEDAAEDSEASKEVVNSTKKHDFSFAVSSPQHKCNGVLVSLSQPPLQALQDSMLPNASSIISTHLQSPCQPSLHQSYPFVLVSHQSFHLLQHIHPKLHPASSSRPLQVPLIRNDRVHLDHGLDCLLGMAFGALVELLAQFPKPNLSQQALIRIGSAHNLLIPDLIAISESLDDGVHFVFQLSAVALEITFEWTCSLRIRSLESRPVEIGHFHDVSDTLDSSGLVGFQEDVVRASVWSIDAPACSSIQCGGLWLAGLARKAMDEPCGLELIPDVKILEPLHCFGWIPVVRFQTIAGGVEVHAAVDREVVCLLKKVDLVERPGEVTIRGLQDFFRVLDADIRSQ